MKRGSTNKSSRKDRKSKTIRVSLATDGKDQEDTTYRRQSKKGGKSGVQRVSLKDGRSASRTSKSKKVADIRYGQSSNVVDAKQNKRRLSDGQHVPKRYKCAAVILMLFALAIPIIIYYFIFYFDMKAFILNRYAGSLYGITGNIDDFNK